MRSRFLRSTVLITLLAVLALGVPLALVARHQVFTSVRTSLRQQASSIAAGLEDRLDSGQPPELARYTHVLGGRRLVVTTARGDQISSGPGLPGELLQASVQMAGSTVTVQTRRGPTATRAREITVLVAGLALLAIAAAVALSVAQARRLSAPLAHLAARADALGRGQFAPAPVRSGIAEVDQISQELERSASQISTMIALQRDFASDAAHQLRTPLTGIGLRLEELVALGGDGLRREAEDALAQVERLESVITSLLARARGDAADPEPLDIGVFLEEETVTWARTFDAVDRRLDLTPGHGMWVRARRGHLTSILTCLLDNALHHGAAEVHVRAIGVGERVVVSVSDAGAGVAVNIRQHIFDRRFSGGSGTGIGLALARSLAEAEAGNLKYRPGQPAAFVLTLPRYARGTIRAGL